MLSAETACIISPCEVVEQIFEHQRDFFEATLAHNVRAFWDSLDENDPRLYNHPMKANPDWKGRAIPIALHGDGASFVKKNHNSLLVVSWRSLLNTMFGIGPFFLFALPKSVRAHLATDGLDSVHALWDCTVFLFNCMFNGTRPDNDHKGNPWEPGTNRARLSGRQLCRGMYCFVVFFPQLQVTCRTLARNLACHTSTLMRLAGCAVVTAQALLSLTSL
jgi:hypothetical protein